jgi:hypothetical protein
MTLQLSEPKILPAEHRFHDTRDEDARRQHQRGVGRKIDCDFDAVSARAHPDCTALPIGCQQNHWRWQNVREQIRQLRRVAKLRSPRVRKREIVVRAETLEAAIALMSLSPMIQLDAKIPDLLPQQARRPITAAGFKLNNRGRNFHDTGIEINCAARGQLKGFAATRNHAAPHQATRIAEYSFGSLSAAVDQKVEFGLQTNYGALWRCTRGTIPAKTDVAMCSSVLHLLNVRLTNLAAFAGS